MTQIIEVSPGVGFSGNPSVGSGFIGANNGGLAPDEIHVTNGRVFTIAGGGLVSNGIFSLNSGGAFTDLSLVGAQMFNASAAGVTGELRMSDNPNNRLVTNNTVLTNGANHRISGAGQVLANTGGLINEGQIVANATTALVIDPNGLGVTNSGLMSGASAAGRVLQNGTLTNFIGGGAGEINAASGSTVLIQSATVIGGIVTTVGTGFIDARASIFDAVSFQDNVTGNGSVEQFDDQDVSITNGLDLQNVTWKLNSSGSHTNLTFVGSQTIAGNGTILLSDHANNRIVNNNVITTIGANTTIRGAWQLGANTGGFISAGTVIAARAVNALVIDPNARGFENRARVIVSGSPGLTSVDDFRQSAGETTVNREKRINPGRLFRLEGGEQNGNGTIFGNVDNSGGIVNAGNSQTPGGTVLVEIAGSAAG